MAEQFQNFFVTKLREACDATATTIYVDTVPAITEGTLVLEYANSTKHEIIHFTGVSGYGLTGCTRGLEGTTAQSHSAGTDVRQNLTAGMIDKIINGVITTENIADGAVTADKIDFTTLSGGVCRYASNQTIAAGVEGVILFPNNVVTDTSVISYNNGTFTVKKKGWYYISAEVGGSSNCQHTTEIFVNGAEYQSSRGYNTAFNYVAVSCCVKLNVNDTFQIKAVAGGSIDINSRAKGNMNACLISLA